METVLDKTLSTHSQEVGPVMPLTSSGILSGLTPQQQKDYLELLFLKRLREGVDEEGGTGEGERRFGPIPFTENPNNVLNRVAQSGKPRERARNHPLITRSQQYSGFDKRLTATPAENIAAQNIYPQLRQANRLRAGLGKSRAPTLSR
jgi:hypothetical protein